MYKYLTYALFSCALFSVSLTGCSMKGVKEIEIGHEDARQLPKELAKEYAVYAMMSSNVYLNSDRTDFDLSGLGWKKVDLDGNETKKNSYTPSWIGKLFSSLQYDIWENDQNMTVIAFKGSDEKVDWFTNFWIGPSVAYKSAKKHVRKYRQKHPEKSVVVTGHSLGGGLALSVSLWLGVDAIVFDTSPRVFDGWGDNKEPAIRKAVFQDKEVLSLLRSLWPKYREVLEDEDIYQTNFDFNDVNKHRIDILAEGMLRCSHSDTGLKELSAATTPVKVECSL